MNLPATFRLACLCAAVTAYFSCGSVAPAPADNGSGSSDCSPALSQPFLPWLDPGSYFLVRGGNFESGTGGWSLAGASVISGNEPWKVSGSGDSHALRLPPGASATAPATCVGLADPTVRFFARNTAPVGLGTLVVTADISAAGVDVRVPIGVVTGGSSFQPTLPLPLLANLTSSLPGSTGTVTLEFTAVGGSWQIDDTYVDPFKTN